MATMPPPSRGGELKERVATPLEPGILVSGEDYRRLRALSVSTVEELLGLIAADPEALSEFLDDADLPQIQADAYSHARGPVLAEFDRFTEPELAMGALAPTDDADAVVEERASAEYVRSWLDQAVTSERREADDDLPGANLIRCFGPVRDQQSRGTCVAHAVAAVLECQRKRLLSEDDDISEQFIYWWAKSNDGYPYDEGTWVRVVAPGSESDGGCLEDIWPYNPTRVQGNEGQGPPPDGAVADAANRLLDSPEDLGGRNVDAIRASLDEGRPVAISVPVYNNWYSNPAANALGLIPMPLPNSVRKGGHAMCAMGYGYDAEFAGGGYFVLRNSWGLDWAPQSPVQAGYGAIPFLYIQKYGWEAWTAA